MVGIKRWWNAFRNVAIFVSFAVNIVLIIVLLVVVSLIFQIKTGIAEPLINGLYSSFVGLNEARILTTINVSDTINVRDTILVRDTITVKDDVPINLNIPLRQNTTVVLTDNVALTANATFTLPGGGGNIRGSVAITLPTGLQLPVALQLNVPVEDKLPIELKVPVNLDVPVDLKVPINLNVPVDIPLEQTQLNDVAQSLRNVVEPFARIINNLPDSWSELWPMIGRILAGNPPNLLGPNDIINNPWPGFNTGVALPTPTPTQAIAPIVVPTIAPPSEGDGQSTPAAPPNTTPDGGPTSPGSGPTPTLFIPTPAP